MHFQLSNIKKQNTELDLPHIQSHKYAYAHSFKCSRMHAHTITNSLFHTQTLSLSLRHSLSQTLTRSDTHSLTLSDIHTLKDTLSLTNSDTHSLSQTLIHFFFKRWFSKCLTLSSVTCSAWLFQLSDILVKGTHWIMVITIATISYVIPFFLYQVPAISWFSQGQLISSA